MTTDKIDQLVEEIEALARRIEDEEPRLMSTYSDKSGLETDGLFTRLVRRDLADAALFVSLGGLACDLGSLLIADRTLSGTGRMDALQKLNEFRKTHKTSGLEEFLPEFPRILGNLKSSAARQELGAAYLMLLRELPCFDPTNDLGVLQSMAKAKAQRDLLDTEARRMFLSLGFTDTIFTMAENRLSTRMGWGGGGKPPGPPGPSAKEKLEGLIGLAPVKTEVGRMAAVARLGKIRRDYKIAHRRPLMHLVFTGNPGTGKTTVARLIGEIYKEAGILEKGHVVECDRSDLVGQHIGHSEKLTAEIMKKAKGGVLFIDEAYALVDGDQRDKRDFGNRVIDKLVADAENYRDNLVIIIAGYPEPMKKFLEANPGLKSRFPKTIHFPDYDMPDLMKIFDFMAAECDMIVRPDAWKAAEKLLEEQRDSGGRDFGNARAVRTLIEMLDAEMAIRLSDSGELDKPFDAARKPIYQTITLADVEKASKTFRLNQGAEAQGAGPSRPPVVGPENLPPKGPNMGPNSPPIVPPR
jgi:stage V sporulation protein K